MATKRLRNVQLEHGLTEIDDVSFTDEGKRIIVSTSGKKIYMFDAATLRLEREKQVHSDAVSCFSISGNLLITGSYDHKIRVWDRETWAPKWIRWK